MASHDFISTQSKKYSKSSYYLEIWSRTESSCLKVSIAVVLNLLWDFDTLNLKKIGSTLRCKNRPQLRKYVCFYILSLTCLDLAVDLEKIDDTPVEKHWSRERERKNKDLLVLRSSLSLLLSLSLSSPVWRGKNKVGDKLPLYINFIH